MASLVSGPPVLALRIPPKLSCGRTHPAASFHDRHVVSQCRKTFQMAVAGNAPRTLRGVSSRIASSRASHGLLKNAEAPELASIREDLIRQEDSIIFNLLERAQYCRNAPTYDANRFAIPGFTGSLVDYLLLETERLHAKVNRYTSPDEHPFYPDALPDSLLPEIKYPMTLHKATDQVNINETVKKMYFDDLLPKLAASGDDGNYGSTATCDVLCLQALSKRIHYGKFVAEAKFLQTPEDYEAHIIAKDTDALQRLITFEDVEKQVRERVEFKARTFGQKVVMSGTGPPSFKIDPELIGRLYWEWVMPLTKVVQTEYLLRRLD